MEILSYNVTFPIPHLLKQPLTVAFFLTRTYNTSMIIAGPCSINEDNKSQLKDIASLSIDGIRVVGLKSRTNLSPSTLDMGVDYPIYIKNRDKYIRDSNTNAFDIYPSIDIANSLIEKYPNLIIATEIVDSALQLPVWDKYFKGKLFIWSPSVNQVGFNISLMSKYLKSNRDWSMGIKNGKWIGNSGYNTWRGLATYIDDDVKDRAYLIHRGFDIKRNMFNKRYRNVPDHRLAKKIKEETGLKLLFDPSHSLGPQLRNNIVRESKEALHSGIYDGLLIEVGDSNTDRKQHISVKELNNILKNHARKNI